jgi:hypothetical protein
MLEVGIRRSVIGWRYRYNVMVLGYWLRRDEIWRAEVKRRQGGESIASPVGESSRADV